MRALLGILMALASALPEAKAQRNKLPAPDDTLVVRALTAGIIALLHDDLTWQVIGGRAAPWVIVVQDSTDIHWGQVQRGLRGLLMRPVVASEGSSYSKLVVGRVQLRGDTAIVEVDLLGGSVSPSGCVSEGGMTYLIRSVRQGERWSVAATRPWRDELPAPCK